METALKESLWNYITTHNPELMFDLQEEYRVSDYLAEKIAAVLPEAERLLQNGIPLISVKEICMEEMTEELKPSKFLYVKRVLEDEFPTAFEALTESYMLNYEVLNIMECCRDIFGKFGFGSENENNRTLRYAIMGEINDYLS
jgi:hypothetical protein